MVEGRIRVEGNVQQAKLLKQTAAVYPPDARSAGVTGTVRLNVVIAKDGTVENVNALSGPPQLIPAAVEAVRNWVYQPTLLNGDPVGVVSVVNINFTLNQ
jgi:protein TonB